MKKILFSAGLVAASAAGIQNVTAAASDLISPKAWSVSGELRGFYDDNYSTGTTKKGSFGFEVSPTISFNLPLQQTDFGIRYTYGLYYYQQREEMPDSEPIDQTHDVDIWLDHAFNERWKANVTDTFVVGQNPELLRPSSAGPEAVPYRVNGDNIANHGNVSLDTQWTRLFSTSLHYNNNFYDYDDSGHTEADVTPGGSYKGASLSGLLDRIEQNAGLDFQWTLQPETKVYVGYNFSIVNYIGDEPIAYSPFAPGGYYHSEDRDSITHYGYAGISHQFTGNLAGNVRGGLSYTDNYNDPLNKTTSWSPYADLSLTYTYLPGSYVELGFTHDINSTDVVQPDSNGHLTQYQESSVVYADINHHFTPKLLATVIGRYQTSEFQDGAYDSESDDTYSAGVNLSYQITQHFSADVGYNYDHLASQIPAATIRATGFTLDWAQVTKSVRTEQV